MQKKFDNFEEGYKEIENGRIWCLILIDQNFSSDLQRIYENYDRQKMLNFKNIIHLYMDNTNQQISYSIRDNFISSVKTVSEKYLQLVGMIGSLNDSYPISFEKPVYGQAQPVFTHFMAPGIALRYE